MHDPFIFNGLDFDMDIELMLFGPKECPGCRRVLAKSSDFFVRDVTADDLWSSHCKECRNGRSAERYWSDPEYRARRLAQMRGNR